MENSLVEIVFMRHARSLADDEGKFEGRYDSPLTNVGREQVLQRAEGWLRAGERFDRVIASPLVRAHESGRIIAETLGVPLELDPDWMEMNNGVLAGLTFEEGDGRYPRPAFRNPYEPMALTGESEYKLHGRAAQAVERVVLRGPGKYLVVAHGGILNAAFRMIMGAPVPINYAGIWFSLGDTGYARFQYNPARHYWSMRELINTSRG